MATTVLITGGARSGKSAYAESLYRGRPQVTYIAAARASDDEMRERIRLHQQSRSPEWITVEATYNLAALVQQTGNTAALLDCVTILASNIMFDLTRGHERIPAALQQDVEDAVLREIEELAAFTKSNDGDLVMVTNEVGYSIVPEQYVARVYRDIVGRINQRAAALCDEVYLVACGIPLRLR